MTRYVLITGATSGIGQATVHALSTRGYSVFATYRDARDRAALADVPNVHPVQLDVSDPGQIRQAISGIDGTLGTGGLYAVVNNAGITYTAPFEYAQPDRVRQIIDINLMAPYLVTQACIPLLRRHNQPGSPKARVVNIASWSGLMAFPFIGFYNATKYALAGLTESMYYDLGLLGIHTVLAIPGITSTPLLSKTTSAATASLDHMPPAARDRYRPHLEHLASMSEDPDLMRLMPPAPQPRFKYNLARDARLIDTITRLLPFTARAAINRRMYQLSNTPAGPETSRATAGTGNTSALAGQHRNSPAA